jgi:hypothetical protein
LHAPFFEEGTHTIYRFRFVEEGVDDEHTARLTLAGELAREEGQSEQGVGTDPDAGTHMETKVGHP